MPFQSVRVEPSAADAALPQLYNLIRKRVVGKIGGGAKQTPTPTPTPTTIIPALARPPSSASIGRLKGTAATANTSNTARSGHITTPLFAIDAFVHTDVAGRAAARSGVRPVGSLRPRRAFPKTPVSLAGISEPVRGGLRPVVALSIGQVRGAVADSAAAVAGCVVSAMLLLLLSLLLLMVMVADVIMVLGTSVVVWAEAGARRGRVAWVGVDRVGASGAFWRRPAFS